MKEYCFEENKQTREEESPIEQHSIPKSILLHLLPGLLISLAFIFLSPLIRQYKLPPLLALIIPIAIVLLPFELGLLFWQGFRQNGRLSLRGIVVNCKTLRFKDYLVFVPILLLWSVTTFLMLQKLDRVILDNVFNWLPDWFQFNLFNPADYSQSVLTITFILFLIMNGFAGPISEELYFRGYLLPRMERFKGYAPLVNVILFSLYHFFSPWQFFTRILAFLPIATVVSRKKNVYLSIFTHCLLNIGYCLMSAGLFFR